MWLYELETMRSSRSEKWHSMAQAKPSSSGTYRRNGYQKSPHTPKLWSKHHKNLNVHFLVDWLSHVRASHGSSNTSFCPKNTAGLWNWKSRAWYLSKGKPLLEDTCQIIKAPIMLKITVVGIDSFSSVTQSCLTLQPPGPQHARLPCPSLTPRVFSNSCPSSQWYYPLLSPSSPGFNLSQHQDLFQWVSSSHQVAKVLEFQPQYHSFQ